MRIALVFLGLSLGVGFGACQCGEPLQVLAPKIQIGDPYDANFSVCATNFVSDCKYDFGEVGIGRPKLFSFVIKNPTNVDLTINSITIEGSPNFTVDGTPPTAVESATGAIGKMVTIKYDPQTETAETAKVIIASDGKNVAAGQNIEIALTGNGKDLGCPIIEVAPTECAFGAVGVGARGTCQLSLKNTGSQELEITDISFTADSPYPTVFGPDGAFVIPAFVQPGTAVTVSFYAVPNVAMPIQGALTVSSNDCQNPSINVPFSVQGASSPTAVARVKSINGTPNSSANPPVQPLDNVIVSGDQSQPGTTGSTITAYAWTLIEKPNDSSIILTDPSSVDTGFQFDNGSTVLGVDVAGTFRVRLTVTDSNGATSQNDAVVTLNAVPTEGLHVQLSWSVPVDDIDLHLGKGNNPSWCSAPSDCYYGDCKNSSFQTPPNWDSVSGFTSGDPSLDIDDLDGFGPENINIVAPVNGTYVIGVHAFSGGGGSGFTPTDLEIKVFTGGALAGTFNGHFDSVDQFWTVAKVDVNNGSTVTAIDTMGTSGSCGF